MSRFVEIMTQIAKQDLPSNQLYDVADDLVAGADAILAENERLRRVLEIAVDAYEDDHGKPNRESHWAARARAELGHQQQGDGK